MQKKDTLTVEEISAVDLVVEIVNDYGFAVLLSIGMGYFIFYVWKYVTEKLEPIIDEQHMTLIKLIDQVRMLDQDQIRLMTKLNTVLEMRENKKHEENNS